MTKELKKLKVFKAKVAKELKDIVLPTEVFALKYLAKVIGNLTISKFYFNLSRINDKQWSLRLFIIESYHSLEFLSNN